MWYLPKNMLRSLSASGNQLYSLMNPNSICLDQTRVRECGATRRRWTDPSAEMQLSSTVVGACRFGAVWQHLVFTVFLKVSCILKCMRRWFTQMILSAAKLFGHHYIFQQDDNPRDTAKQVKTLSPRRWWKSMSDPHKARTSMLLSTTRLRWRGDAQQIHKTKKTTWKTCSGAHGRAPTSHWEQPCWKLPRKLHAGIAAKGGLTRYGAGLWEKSNCQVYK